jgi:hypothetical protein
MRGIRALSSVVMSVAAVAATTVAASATTTDAVPQGGWHRYHQPDFTVPAADACGFDVKVKVMYDREFYRTLSRYDDGTPHLQLWRGPLILKYVNVETGKSIIRNASGVAYESLNPDGSFHAIRIISGHFSAVLRPGSDPETGLFYVSGHGSRLVVEDDGTEVLTLGRHGSAENLCIPLGDS